MMPGAQTADGEELDKVEMPPVVKKDWDFLDKVNPRQPLETEAPNFKQ